MESEFGWMRYCICNIGCLINSENKWIWVQLARDWLSGFCSLRVAAGLRPMSRGLGWRKWKQGGGLRERNREGAKGGAITCRGRWWFVKPSPEAHELIVGPAYLIVWKLRCHLNTREIVCMHAEKNNKDDVIHLHVNSKLKKQ